MSESRHLLMDFKTATGKSARMTLQRIKDSITNLEVKDVMESFIANGTIFQNVPGEIESAYVVDVFTDSIDLGD